MEVEEDLEHGRQLLPYFKEFLHFLYDGGLARKTFVRYRDNVWLLGGTIISKVSFCEKYQDDPLHTLFDSVECDGVLPDHHEHMSKEELHAFSRMAVDLRNIFNDNSGRLSQQVTRNHAAEADLLKVSFLSFPGVP